MIIFSLGFTFSLASVPGEETGIDSLSVTGPGAVQPASVQTSESFSLFRLNSSLYVSQMIYLWSLKHLRTQIDYIHEVLLVD